MQRSVGVVAGAPLSRIRQLAGRSVGLTRTPSDRSTRVTVDSALLLRSELVTLIFPVGDFAGGPPFAAQPLAVRSLLEGAGFECAELGPVPPELSHPARAVRPERWSLHNSHSEFASSTRSHSARNDGAVNVRQQSDTWTNDSPLPHRSPRLSCPTTPQGREYLGRWRHDTRRYPVAGATLRAQRRADG